jgi:hypothetical protein
MTTLKDELTQRNQQQDYYGESEPITLKWLARMVQLEDIRMVGDYDSDEDAWGDTT